MGIVSEVGILRIGESFCGCVTGYAVCRFVYVAFFTAACAVRACVCAYADMPNMKGVRLESADKCHDKRAADRSFLVIEGENNIPVFIHIKKIKQIGRYAAF